MSFILEAIRRSEEARNKRLIPAVSTIHAAPAAPVRSGSRALPATLAMGSAVALAVTAGLALVPWLRPVQEPGRPAPVVATAPPPAEPGERDDAATEGTPAATEPPPAAAEPAPASPPPGPPETASPAPTSPAAAAAAAPAGEPATEARRPRRPYSSPSGEAAKAKREPRPVAAAPQPGAGPDGGDPSEAEPVAQPPPASEIVAATALRDLPPSVQRTLPNIAITLHRYATTADARMIRVNGRMAREGDVLGGELGVAEITRNGVVFTVAGQRFYMDAFQSWQAKGGS